jgi:hypothetical protein
MYIYKSTAHERITYSEEYLAAAGQNVQASQQFVSSKVSWFTGGFFQQLFQVDPKYGAAD